MKHFQRLSAPSLAHFSEVPFLSATARLARQMTTVVAIAVMSNIALISGLGISAQSASGLPIRTRIEPSQRQFEVCAGTLVALGLELPTAVDACGAAAAPKALSSCIEDISNDTLIPLADAVEGCVRVRRPDEMASCVVGLDDDFAGTLSSEILRYCGRSLLPVVFKNCVQGISDETEAEPMLIMRSCVEAEYDPAQDFLPSFQPTESET